MNDSDEDMSADPMALVTAVLFHGASSDLLDRANRTATSTRDRQIVAIATAYVDGDHDLVGALVRDHLVSQPNHPIVSWIITQSEQGAQS